MAGIRSFFDVPIRYAWVTLLVPMLFACKFLFPGFDPWPDDAWPAYPFAWLIAFAVFACILVPIQLCYAHLAPRLGVGDFGTRRAILFHAVTVPGCEPTSTRPGSSMIRRSK